MIAYELHTLRNGQWKMDSVFDDRGLALSQATQADDSKRYAGIRLIEENYDENTEKATTRVIFRGGTAAKTDIKKPPPPAAKPKTAAPKAATGRDPKRTIKPRQEPTKKSNLFVPVFASVALVTIIGGAAAMWFLSH